MLSNYIFGFTLNDINNILFTIFNIDKQNSVIKKRNKPDSTIDTSNTTSENTSDNTSSIQTTYSEKNDKIYSYDNLDRDFGININNGKTSNEISGSVFNIKDNIYNYNQAKALCRSFGARLATPSELFNEYKKGNSWCDLSWSSGQNILFPSQKIDVELANNDKKTYGKCGKEGVNGYYIEDPDEKYPVNCYKDN
tara:strand:+ start:13 stop:597 length:585 start_codon:yes stop_codon:yes gene_type:complete